MLPHAPGVQMQVIPEDAIDIEMEEDQDKQNGEERISIRASEKRICNENELSDSEDEGDNRKDIRSNKKAKKTRQTESTPTDSKMVSEKSESKEAESSNSVDKTGESSNATAMAVSESTTSDDKK